MSIMKKEIQVPLLPESVVNAKISKWHKNIGDQVKYNDNLLDLETDKIVLEVPCPSDGILQEIIKKEGDLVISKDVLGIISNSKSIQRSLINKNFFENKIQNNNMENNFSETPNVRRLLKLYNIDIQDVKKKCSKSKITHIDIENYIRNIILKYKNNKNIINNINEKKSKRNINRISMTPIRRKISERLLESVRNTATLTTFQEVDMSNIINIRKKYNEKFQNKYNIKLGFMSFYIKSVVACLQKIPQINAAIDGNDIIYYDYFDISIAISTSRGLITPVLKDVDTMKIHEIEKKIKYFAEQGENGKLDIKNLIGGNFTISNGGIFGSLISTPIINPPQSAILGIHVIKDRPIAVNGKIKILPMVYLALSYDHRIIDGKEAASFLIELKNILEDYSRIIFQI